MNTNEFILKMIFKYMDDETKQDINDFYLNCINREYKDFDDEIDLMMFENDIKNIEVIDAVRSYSGYNFKNINNALRGKWNYEENGDISKIEDSKNIGETIIKYISNNQKSIGNVMVYRGVDIDYFNDYGIKSLEELKTLEDNYLVDSGLVSTSLLRNRSFFESDNELGKNYNIEIRYKVPEEFGDGIYLSNNLLATPSKQCEYLINTCNIAKVSKVEIDSNKAMIDALLIPKQIYDKTYMVEERKVK